MELSIRDINEQQAINFVNNTIAMNNKCNERIAVRYGNNILIIDKKNSNIVPFRLFIN